MQNGTNSGDKSMKLVLKCLVETRWENKLLIMFCLMGIKFGEKINLVAKFNGCVCGNSKFKGFRM